jgi:hypothetical protein
VASVRHSSDPIFRTSGTCTISESEAPDTSPTDQAFVIRVPCSVFMLCVLCLRGCSSSPVCRGSARYPACIHTHTHTPSQKTFSCATAQPTHGYGYGAECVRCMPCACAPHAFNTVSVSARRPHAVWSKFALGLCELQHGMHWVLVVPRCRKRCAGPRRVFGSRGCFRLTLCIFVSTRELDVSA